jgi:hypothetical protein
MTKVNEQKPSMLDAFTRLVSSGVNETGRAVGEFAQHKIDDLNSVAHAVENDGLIGGYLQFLDKVSVGNNAAHLLDAGTGKGNLSPEFKKGVAAAANLATGNPIFLKNLFDMANAPSKPGVKPSPANTAPPPPKPEATRGASEPQAPKAPSAPGAPPRTGYTESPAPPRSQQQITVIVVSTTGSLSETFGALDQLKDNPAVKANYPELYAALNDKRATLGDISMLMSASVLKDNPEILQKGYDLYKSLPEEDIRFTIQPVPVGNGVEEPRLTTQPVGPNVPLNVDGPQEAPPDFFGQAMEMFQQIAGPLGMGMQVLGGILSNPIVANVIAPLLVQAVNVVLPGSGAILGPLMPVLLPIAGQALSMGGGLLASQAGGPGGGAPAGLPLDDLGGLLGGLSSAFGGAGGVPGLPPGLPF